MPRYILIDNASGYIFGDTADYAAGRDVHGAIEAARLLDESLGVHGRIYRERFRKGRSGDGTGYNVYRADIDGSEAVPVVYDGQDQETINAVIHDCEHIAFVAVDSEPTD